MYDVIIVGSRIAGSITGTILGENGHRVLVLDRARFPSDTLSTHFFRAPSLRAFQRISIHEDIQATAPQLRVNYNVVDGIVFPEPVEEPEDYPFHMCVRRITLDDILVRRLKQTPNVKLLEGAKVDSLVWEEDRVVGVTWKGSDDRNEARAKVVIGADGLRSFVAKGVNAEYEAQEPVNRAMYYAYFRGIEPQEGPAAEFHYRGNHLAYVIPCDDDLTLIAISVPIDMFGEFKRDPEGNLMEKLGEMKEIAPRLENAERDGPIRGSGSVSGYLRIPYGPGWALVGDASMVMDPWSGQGIDQASTHAVMLARHLDEFLAGEKGWDVAMKAYHEARNEFSMKTYRRTCTFSRDLRPMTHKALERRGLVLKNY
jgi:2-polyprenyl-6-methoxyphenol hydroxylase-like FAD-dependent oxidoreductase